MEQAARRSRAREFVAIGVLAVASHLIFVAMQLAAFTTMTGQFTSTIMGTVWLLFGLWLLCLWAARRLSSRWLATLSVILVLYGALNLLRAASIPEINPQSMAFASSIRLAAAGLVFWGVVAGALVYRRRRLAGANATSTVT